MAHGTPELVNTEQGSRFNAEDFVSVVIDRGCQCSRGGRGALRDNVFVEPFWRTIKCDEIYSKTYDSTTIAWRAIATLIDWFNNDRPHSSVGRVPPMCVDEKPLPTLELAA